MADQDQERTVMASNEDLRRLLTLIHETLSYGSTAVAVVLGVGWGFLGLKEDLAVPPMLPILTVAAVMFALVAWTMQEDIQRIGRPYRSTRS